MNLKHEAALVKLHAQEFKAGVIYWRKAWDTRRPSGWVVLGVKMNPVSRTEAKRILLRK